VNKVLLIEDSKEYQEQVQRILSHYNVMIIEDPKKTIETLEANKIDLVILDVNNPKRDGFSALQEIRLSHQFSDLFVVCTSSKDHISDRVAAYSLGADDYIQKPFHPIDFRVRIDAKFQKLRRLLPKNLEIGDVIVDFNSHRVTSAITKKEIMLTQTEFKILTYMGRHFEKVFTREELLSAIWGSEGAVFDRSVDVHVCSIRKKLASHNVQFKSISGVGYRLEFGKKKSKTPSNVNF